MIDGKIRLSLMKIVFSFQRQKRMYLLIALAMFCIVLVSNDVSAACVVSGGRRWCWGNFPLR